MNRDDVLSEFGVNNLAHITMQHEDMADEIVHLRRIVATYGKVDLSATSDERIVYVSFSVPAEVLRIAKGKNAKLLFQYEYDCVMGKLRDYFMD